MTQQPVRSPCVGLCSTTYGDLICRGCRRTSKEITDWHGLSEIEKRAIVDRLDTQIANAFQSIVVIDDQEILKQQLQRLQIHHDINRSAWAWLFVLLVKKHDAITDPSEYGFRVLSSTPLSKLTRHAMIQMYQAASH